MSTEIINRLLSRTRRDGECLIWIGAAWRGKYNRQRKRAHILMRQLCGYSNKDYLTNCCGHKNCINPAHWENHLRPGVVDRILSYTRPEGNCLLWTKKIDREGYARVNYRRKYMRRRAYLAHRILWEETHRRALGSYAHLRNLCGNRHCVNLNHWRRMVDIRDESALRARLKRLVKRCTASYEFLNELYRRQGGLCYYSNIPMQYTTGCGRDMLSVDPKDLAGGYCEDNIVLCCRHVKRCKYY